MVQKRMASFIIPHYWKDLKDCQKYLPQTLRGVEDQTDPDWHIIVIDDNSPGEGIRDYLKAIEKNYQDKLSVILKDTNDGAGVCRNIGIELADKMGSAFVLFNDADDISHPRRVETVRRILREDPEIDLVYSTFHVIDEENHPVPLSKLAPTIREEIESHHSGPPQGENAWIDIGTTKGYSNLTSSTAVRTELAVRYPFPPERISEDSHTWMRYSAGGKKFFYLPDIPTLYRVPQNVHGSSSWAREGGKHYFLEKKTQVDTEGFKEAIRIATQKSKIQLVDADNLLLRFHLRLAETLVKENETDLAGVQIQNALKIAKNGALKVINESNLLKHFMNFN